MLRIFIYFFYSRRAVSVVSTLLSCPGFIIFLLLCLIYVMFWTNKDDDTLETRYNALQYNANSVITWLRCWLPFRWELHPATASTAGRDAWSKICRPPTLCTRDRMQQRGLLCTCMSSIHLCRKGREEWVMSNVARLVATGCDVVDGLN